MGINIFWFRRDLRLEDNIGLLNSLKNKEKVIPIFIYDKNITDSLEKNDARLNFIDEQLLKINDELKKNESSLATFYAKNPLDVFKKLTSENTIKAVFTNHDYEPYAIKRDQDIATFLNTIKVDFYSFKDQVIFEKNEIVKADGLPYTVYTPYSKKWISNLNSTHLICSDSLALINNCVSHNYPFFSSKEIGFSASKIKVQVYLISNELIDFYEENRNFPSINGTSNLAPYLRFGTVSIRQMVKEALESKNQTFLKELIWREFFMQILWHFPHTVKNSFKPKYDSIQWRNNEEEFKHWCNGTTGYPLVDAGMRQLNETGTMHNRVRMVVASFLCKHLLIDWRWGEAYFANKLLDYELSSNVGNWQWVAGSGVDAAPYFRIFNPSEQAKKFDSNATYIKKWVKEFEEITYPQPIVEHTYARNRCLNAYKKVLDQK